MYGKTDILTLDTVFSITGIRRLIRQSRYPDNITAVGTNLIYYGLEIELKVLEMPVTRTAISTVRTFYLDGFIGKFEHYASVVFQFRML